MQPLACLLAIATTALAADPALMRVIEESRRLRALPADAPDLWKPTRFHDLIRVWVEGRLPQLDEPVPDLAAELKSNALMMPDKLEDFAFKPGLVTQLVLTRPKEDPSKIGVVIGVSHGCGTLDQAFIYDSKVSPPKRVFESRPAAETQESIHFFQISKPDSAGNQLVFVVRFAMQCGSSWNELAYEICQLGRPKPLLSSRHEIWFGGGPAEIKLEPGEVQIELSAASIDKGIHNRRHLLRYRITRGAVTRIDPIALSPRDFVEEWLEEPWTEAQLRTIPSARSKLRAIHGAKTERAAEFEDEPRQCQGNWQIGLTRKRTEYFLVEQGGPQQFRMLDVRSTPHPTCH